MEKVKKQKHHLGFKQQIELMDLPWGIICCILSRLPLKSIGKFMCVSKTFCDIKNDTYFLDLHVKNAKSQPLNFILKEQPESADISFRTPTASNRFDPAKTLYMVSAGKNNMNTIRIPIIDQVQDKMLRLVGSCNGLLCLSRDKLNESLIIYNPITGEYMPVPTTFDNVGVRYINVSISFVFEVVSKKYKVVVLYPVSRKREAMEVYILTLGETSWRKSILPFGLKFIKYNSDNNRSVLWNESLCWSMKKMNGTRVILTMDISTEKFQDIYFNDSPLQSPSYPHTPYTLLNCGKSLGLAAQMNVSDDDQNQMNVWVLVDVKKGIWNHHSKHHLRSFLKCNPYPDKYNCFVDRNAGDDSLLIGFNYFDESMKGTTYVLGPGCRLLVCYTPKDKKFSIDIGSDGEIPYDFDIFPFLPSIVSPRF